MPDARLYNADCLEVLRALPRVDAIVTDPPYGIDFQSHGQVFRDSESIVGDHSVDAIHGLHEWCDERSVPLASFYSPFKPPCVQWRNVLCWYKGPQVGIGGDRETCWKRDIELIGVSFNRALNGKRDTAMLDFPADVQKPSGHFAEKPIALMEYLIEKLTNVGDTVLDPYMGSGSTGVACMNTGRNFIGVEIDKGYFDIAERRISAAAAQLKLFVA